MRGECLPSIPRIMRNAQFRSDSFFGGLRAHADFHARCRPDLLHRTQRTGSVARFRSPPKPYLTEPPTADCNWHPLKAAPRLRVSWPELESDEKSTSRTNVALRVVARSRRTSAAPASPVQPAWLRDTHPRLVLWCSSR